VPSLSNHFGSRSAANQNGGWTLRPTLSWRSSAIDWTLTNEDINVKFIRSDLCEFLDIVQFISAGEGGQSCEGGVVNLCILGLICAEVELWYQRQGRRVEVALCKQ